MEIGALVAFLHKLIEVATGSAQGVLHDELDRLVPAPEPEPAPAPAEVPSGI